MTEKKATFTLTASPTMFEQGDVLRMTYYNVVYPFTDVGNGNGKVELTTRAKSSPIVQAPDWLVNGWFLMDRLITFVEFLTLAMCINR